MYVGGGAVPAAAFAAAAFVAVCIERPRHWRLVAIIVGAIVAVLAIGIGIYMMKKGPKTAPGTKGVA